jgi:hypothetical protein
MANKSVKLRSPHWTRSSRADIRTARRVNPNLEGLPSREVARILRRARSPLPNGRTRRSIYETPAEFGEYALTPRRAYRSFDTEEGQVHVVRWGGKRRIWKPVSKDKKEAQRAYVEARLLYAMFPQYVPKPLMVEHELEQPSPTNRRLGSKPRMTWGVVYHMVRPRSTAYKRFQEAHYATLPEYLYFGEGPRPSTSKEEFLRQVRETAVIYGHGAEFDEHMRFYREQALPVLREMARRGVVMSNNPVNVINSNGKVKIVDYPVAIDPEIIREMAQHYRPYYRERILDYLERWVEMGGRTTSIKDRQHGFEG